jgi:hypothetical protein
MEASADPLEALELRWPCRQFFNEAKNLASGFSVEGAIDLSR